MVVSWDEIEKWVRHRIRMQPATRENFEKVARNRFPNAVIQLLDGEFFPARIEMARTAEEVEALLQRLQQEDLAGQGFFSFKVFVGRDAECAEKLAADFRERYIPRDVLRKRAARASGKREDSSQA